MLDNGAPVLFQVRQAVDGQGTKGKGWRYDDQAR
jgi:hypothetical protein